MDLTSSITFDNIKIEADSDCAFFGLATSINDSTSASDGAAASGNYSNVNKLSTLLSSVSPYSISSSSPTNNGNCSPKPVSASIVSASTGESPIEDPINGALFSSSEIAELELDLPDFTCDFDILDDDGFMDTTSSLLRDDSDSKDSGTSSTPDVFFNSPSSIDTPPLTPPSPIIKVETETKPLSPCSGGTVPSSVFPILQNLPNGTNLTKILPALKSSRGRSASHDSPDVQALKRHIRMIRNRESASLSRKKKKEYVTSLEQRLKELESENVQLRQENQLLKTRLLMQQQNNCHSSQNSKTNGLHLASSTSGRIGQNTNKTKLIAKVALLGVCCFMILSTHPPISKSSHFKMEALANDSTDSKVLQNLDGPFPRHLPDFPTNHLRLSRSLSWHDDLKETHHKEFALEEDNLMRANKTMLKKHPKDGPTNRTATAAVNFSATYPKYVHVQPRQRPQALLNHTYRNATLPLRPVTDVPTTNCKASFNKTESLRVQNDLKGLFNRGKPEKKRRKPKPFFYSTVDANTGDYNKGLTVYDQRMQKYSNFLEKIQLREDTFYVVSLAMDDQLLLSAKSSNASARPKMSFLMPWRNDSVGGKEEVMQIDCEVTKVLNLNMLRKAKP